MREPELGPFRVTEPLGSGGMGQVFGGIHIPTGRAVAIKVLSPEWAHNTDARRAFREEVRAVASLAHPAVIRVHDHGEVHEDAARGTTLPVGAPYLVMELLAGTLRPRAGRLAWPELRGVLLSLLDALAHAHARGIVHRDIKASNVLIGPTGVKLADFGIAWVAEGGPAATSVSGTPAYMAPEQIAGDWRRLGPPTDLYALGCLAWLLVTGRAPFRGSWREVVAQQIEQRLPPLPRRAPVPRGFEAWLDLLTRKEPRERYQFAADAAADLLTLPDVANHEPRGEALPPLPEGSTVTLVVDQPTVRAELRAAPSEAPPPAPVPVDWRPAGHGRSDTLLRGGGLGLFGLREVPLVGREAERDALWATLLRVCREGRPEVVTLRGAAGAGKSRLARWLCERAHEVGAASWLRATHSERPQPGDGVGAALRRLLRVPDADAVDLEQAVGTLGITDREARTLVRCLAVEPDPTVPPGERRYLFRRALAALAQDRPLVLWLDDAQWGSSSLALAREVLAGDVPILVLLTVRDEALAERPIEAALVPEGERTASLALGPLDRLAHEEFVARLLGLDTSAVVAIAARTAGNPLFALQLVGDWVDRGVLESGPQGLRPRDGVVPELPADLTAVWRSRLASLCARLPPGADAAIEVAAVLGTRVDPIEWTDACLAAGVPADPAVLDSLLDHRLLTAEAGGRALEFVHGMVREAVLAGARERGRFVHLHRAAMLALADRTDPLGQARYGLHAADAGESDIAAEALDRALANGAKLGPGVALVAADALDRVLDALAVPDDDPRQLRAIVHRARHERMHGDAAKALALLEPVLARPPTPATYAPVFDGERLWAEVAATHGRAAEGVVRLEAALASARALELPSEVLPTLISLGFVLIQAGRRPDARAAFDEARTMPGVPPMRVAQLDLAQGECALAMGERDAARAHFAASRVGFEALNYTWGVGHAIGMMADVSRIEKDYATARTMYLESRQLFEQSGSPSSVFIDMSLALIEVATGRYADADQILVRVEATLERRGQWGHRALCRALRAACGAALGAWVLFDACLTDVEALPHWQHVEAAHALRRAAGTARGAGEADRADRAFRAAIAMFERLDHPISADEARHEAGG